MKKFVLGLTAFNVVLVGAALLGLAQEVSQFQEGGLVTGLKAIAASVAFFGGALSTAIAQSRIGTAAIGAVAENPSNFGMALVLVALPETMVILGFVTIFLL